jgi:hypothetical protein
VLAHDILLYIRLGKSILATAFVLLDPLGVREVKIRRVQDVSLDAIVCGDWPRRRCSDLVFLRARAVAGQVRRSITLDTLGLKLSASVKVTRLTAVMAYNVPAAMILKLNDCLTFLDITNEVVKRLHEGGFLARTNHDGTNPSTRKSDGHGEIQR